MEQIAAHAPEAEEQLLGQILLDDNVLDKVGEYIPHPDVFYAPENKVLWDIISKMKKRGDTIDTITVISNTPQKQKDLITGSYLTGLTSEVVAISNADKYAKIIFEKWLVRKVVQKSDRIKNLVHVEANDAYNLLQSLHNEIEEILNMRTRERFNLGSLVEETAEHIMAHDNVIPFMYPQLDALTGGMTRGEITVIAGRPGMFKSTGTLNIIRRLVHQGLKVLVFNREMSNVEMMKKFIVVESECMSYGTLRAETLTDNDINDMENSKSVITDEYQNLIMFDNIFDIEQSMREVRKHRPDVVIDDYIGLIDVMGIEDNRLRVDSIMKQYKRACKTYNMSAVLVSQLNRECESRANKRPILRDLRDSGSIEQDAEMVLFMYYDYRYHYHDSDGGENELEVIIGKNRYGRTGGVSMGVIGDRCTIFDTVDEAIQDSYRILKSLKKRKK
mgnify:CR=1 FL=1